ncbi:hypothetical protein PPACK8108_LOCUS14686 [Phakopsora pachyrhizi]|uniref:Uncharacterized protein n=1 Tax=Phakopsora pachyrhizi TaxID=170000 RepID=A0AAV0B885_PHAPC|nr:hypothetical protein PPACK8108_LOCUS14686 [Phakopsora pachyrhizi]
MRSVSLLEMKSIMKTPEMVVMSALEPSVRSLVIESPAMLQLLPSLDTRLLVGVTLGADDLRSCQLISALRIAPKYNPGGVCTRAYEEEPSEQGSSRSLPTDEETTRTTAEIYRMVTAEHFEMEAPECDEEKDYMDLRFMVLVDLSRWKKGDFEYQLFDWLGCW